MYFLAQILPYVWSASSEGIYTSINSVIDSFMITNWHYNRIITSYLSSRHQYVLPNPIRCAKIVHACPHELSYSAYQVWIEIWTWKWFPNYKLYLNLEQQTQTNNLFSSISFLWILNQWTTYIAFDENLTNSLKNSSAQDI